MCRAHGAKTCAFHLAVSDTDMKQDTKTNIHVRARLSDSQYQSWGAVALEIRAQASASPEIQASVCLPSLRGQLCF